MFRVDMNLPTRPLMAFAAITVLSGAALSGCVSTVASVITAPVRITSKAVDMATTSQSESDEKRGRDLRHREERLGQLERAYQKHMRQCDDGDDDACLKARNESAEMQSLRYN